MKISYEIRTEDFVAFNLNFLKSDQTMQKRLRMTQLVGVVVILLAVAAYSVLYGAKMAVIGLGALAAILFALYIPYSVKGSVKKSVEQVLKNSAKTALGEKTLAIEEERLHLSGIGEDGLYEYGNISRLIAGEQHYFIYTGAMEALILPHRAFDSEAEREAFYAALCDKVTAAGGKIG